MTGFAASPDYAVHYRYDIYGRFHSVTSCPLNGRPRGVRTRDPVIKSHVLICAFVGVS